MADVSRFGTRVRRRWDEEDESDVDDLLIMLIELTETDESTAKQVFCSFSCFPGNVLPVVKSCGDMRDFKQLLIAAQCCP